MASLFLQILQFATKIGINDRRFSADSIISKNFKKLPLVESLIHLRQDYRLQPRTLLHSVTEDFYEGVWKQLRRKLSKIVRSGVLF